MITSNLFILSKEVRSKGDKYLRINKIDAKSKKFRELCLKYGTEEIYNMILDDI
jgi:hypothetical protein